MNANTLMPKEFLSGADVHDVKGKPTTISAVISGVRQVEVGQDKETRWALTFKGTERKLTLNKTNLGTLIDQFGPETDDWTGKAISLVGTTTEYQGKRVKAIRIAEPVDNAPDLTHDEDIKSFDPESVPF